MPYFRGPRVIVGERANAPPDVPPLQLPQLQHVAQLPDQPHVQHRPNDQGANGQQTSMPSCPSGGAATKPRSHWRPVAHEHASYANAAETRSKRHQTEGPPCDLSPPPNDRRQGHEQGQKTAVDAPPDQPHPQVCHKTERPGASLWQPLAPEWHRCAA